MLSQAKQNLFAWGTQPATAGLGLKPEHFNTIVETWPELGFFEIHAENYMVDGGLYHHFLTRIREHYALSIHGVGLSIGGHGPLDKKHLDRLSILLDRYQPAVFSEHLAWSSHNGVYLNDLLPIPYTNQSLQRICNHIDQVQNHLKRQILIENPATYVEFITSDMDESSFISQIIHHSGCGLLLDINNIHVSCTNHGRNAFEYLNALPLTSIQEIHLAGFAIDQDAKGGPLLIDSHSTEIAAEVWSLYETALTLYKPVPTLIERDNNIPAFHILLAEAQKAQQLLQKYSTGEA